MPGELFQQVTPVTEVAARPLWPGRTPHAVVVVVVVVGGDAAICTQPCAGPRTFLFTSKLEVTAIERTPPGTMDDVSAR